MVVVAWNSAQDIGDCIDAALATQPAEVVVVDNASTDATVACLRRFGSAVRVLGQAHNSGFAAGCNLGAACTAAPYVLFLNDDARLARDYLETLVRALRRRPDAASAVGKLLQPGRSPARIDSAGIQMDAYALRPLDRGHGQVDVGQYDRPGDIFGPSGAAALYRRAAWEEAGETPFDPELFAYYEDVDLAWRLGRRGWRHLYVPDAVATHLRRGPDGKPAATRATAFVNRYKVWRKNETPGRFALYGPLAVAWEGGRLARLAWRDPPAWRQVMLRVLPALVGKL